MSKSINLKNKIINYDKDYNRLIKSDFEKEKEKLDKELLIKAQKDIEENFDEVKYMNSIMLNAQLASIRDKQIEEIKKLKLMNKKIEEKLDLISEIERLKDLNNKEKLEKKLNEKKIEGNKELEKQMLFNKKLKEEQKKLIQKEYEDILKYQEKLKKEDEEKTKKEKEKGKKLINEIIEENKRALEIKKNKKLKEIEEDQKLIEYNKNKAIEEEKKIKELKEQQIKKELEIGKMKEMQEKLSDKKHLVDEIISRRAFEHGEKMARQKEKEDLIKKQKMLEDIKSANKKMIEF